MMRLNLEFQDMTGPVAFDDLEHFILCYNALDRSARIVAGYECSKHRENTFLGNVVSNNPIA